jgi:CRISPR-associated endonuclease/helicase Cas3
VNDFQTRFEALTGNAPFPWQTALYQRFTSDRPDNIPPACNLPTGLGKTSVIAVWLIALANKANVPRRLVYVVNRRTVVDQTTDEVEKYRGRLREAGIVNSLRALCGANMTDDDSLLALSTLRGQFADNREWSADPSRPAIICGTVDMIGSRLLFSGYGVGMKAKPLHAGFLGQDSLLVHDEAHLEPAFQKLLEAIRDEQARCKDFCPMRVMELTATSRGNIELFGLSDEDRANATVQKRIGAPKALHLEPIRDPKKLAEQLAEQAKQFDDKNRAVLVFARTVADVMRIRDKLPKGRVETLTGTMRGKERDKLIDQPIFKRFLSGGASDEETTYLVCTSAGEVGVNISADHLVCDLTTFDSMAQRFGRVNRFGQRRDTEIHVSHPKEEALIEGDGYDKSRQRTLALLRDLNGDASPDALDRLDPIRRREAFSPDPTFLPATDILFDAWALTTIKDKLPGRPPVEPYLHGIADWQPPETQVAWRKEVELVTGDLLETYRPADLLDAYPLKPHELLKEPSDRVFKELEAMAKRLVGNAVPVWLLDDAGVVEPLTLEELTDKDAKERIRWMTVILPPFAGGLKEGMLDGAAPAPDDSSLDVADEWFLKDRDGTLIRQRKRLLDIDPEDDVETAGMHSVVTLVFSGAVEDANESIWEWLTFRNEGEKSAQKPVLWGVHVADVVKRTEDIVANLPLDPALKDAIIAAARYHDHGKRRLLFQRVLGNANPDIYLAKSGKRGGRIAETYRHEFGSLLDAEGELTGEHRDLILHLIAAHHGRARPHFPVDEAFDPERPSADAERMAAETPRRFGRLQRRYGRWGLAYLESLLRAADWAASAAPSKFFTEGDQ